MLKADELSNQCYQHILNALVFLEGLLYQEAVKPGEQYVCYVCTCHYRKQHLRTFQRPPEPKSTVSIGGLP